MKSILRVFASGLLLSGCANGGAFVSTGTVDYGKLIRGIQCEIVDAYAQDTKLKRFEESAVSTGWIATVSVIVKGNFMREGGVSGDLDKYGIGIPDKLTVKGKFSRKTDDLGTVTLGTDPALVRKMECNETDGREYNMSRLGLGARYRNIGKNVSKPTDANFLRGLEFKRTVTFVFVNGSVRLDLLKPVVVGPSLGINNDNIAEIKINLIPPPTKTINTVNLSDETLLALARLIRSGGAAVGSGGGGPASSKSRDREDREVLERIKKEKAEDNLELLQKLEILE